ncbi:MAG: hypothetical protein VR72_19600 [Clostridiaceae bacterium BRH_c20a]|nr:MAG: hypothetical protein VR72_19600 [Clostridiaceae bacterium BRH_c20a]
MRNKKVTEVNLEYGMPTVDVALQRMKNSLTTHKGQGGKAVILIHGYGASGVGGSIKNAVKKCLGENSMRGIVKAYAGGEEWSNRKREIQAMCKSLETYEKSISNNEGVTVVILR